MPKLKAINSYQLFRQTLETPRGMRVPEIYISAVDHWKSMSEGEKAEWKVKWEETRVKLRQEFQEWKAKNDGTPKMKELLDALDKFAILRSKDGWRFKHPLVQ